MNKIFCLVGPSGAGKDTIKKAVGLPYIISYRTRPKRKNEKEGIDGYFISVKQFKEFDKLNLWIAKTEYPEGSGNYYGITAAELEPLKDSPLLYVVDYTGVITLKESLRNTKEFSSEQVISIFIHSDEIELVNRMIDQGRDTKEIEKRIKQFTDDLKVANQCDYIVKNKQGQFESTLNDIYRIILKETFPVHN